MNLLRRKRKLKKNKIDWLQQKRILEEQIELKKQKKKFFEDNKIIKKPKISTSKKIVLFLFINCSLIELFTGYITIIDLKLAETIGAVDFVPIVTLIGAVVSEIIGFAIYAVKATKENTNGGIKYQAMMNQFENNNNCEG